jgi:hypothetical protein
MVLLKKKSEVYLKMDFKEFEYEDSDDPVILLVAEISRRI